MCFIRKTKEKNDQKGLKDNPSNKHNPFHETTYKRHLLVHAYVNAFTKHIVKKFRDAHIKIIFSKSTKMYIFIMILV